MSKEFNFQSFWNGGSQTTPTLDEVVDETHEKETGEAEVVATSNENVQTSEENYHIKLVLLGDPAVGKSSILQRYTDDTFSENYLSTIGVDFKIRHIGFNEKSIKLLIWDTAGQERFRTLISSYMRGAQGILIVYDVTNADSLESVEKWLDEVNCHASDSVPRLLVGNKTDLKAARAVEFSTAQALADKHKMVHLETSAKTSDNLAEVFEAMVSKIMAKMTDETA